jgi:signal peptidase II
MVRRIVNHTLVYLLAGLVVLADQYSKHLVRQLLPVGATWNPWPWLAPYARVLHIENTGAAFGMFQDAGLFFAVVAVVVSLVIVTYARKLPHGLWWIRVALGLQLGGALGNLIDRLIRGPVTDFISVGQFAIFNVADASISTGVALLALLMLLEARQPKGPEAAAEAPPPADARELG